MNPPLELALAPLRAKSLCERHYETQACSQRTEPVAYCTQINNNSFLQHFIHMPTPRLVCNTEMLPEYTVAIYLTSLHCFFLLFQLISVGLVWCACIWLDRYSIGWLVIALVVFFVVLIHPHRGPGLDKVVIDRLHILLWLILNTPTPYIYILTWMGRGLPFFDLIRIQARLTNTFNIERMFALSRRIDNEYLTR